MSRWFPVFIAIFIAGLVTVYYIVSGHGSLDLYTRQLQNQNNVQGASTSDQNTITVTCKNGEKYEIVYKEGQNNFDDLVYNKCGSEGAEK